MANKTNASAEIKKTVAPAAEEVKKEAEVKVAAPAAEAPKTEAAPKKAEENKSAEKAAEKTAAAKKPADKKHAEKDAESLQRKQWLLHMMVLLNGLRRSSRLQILQASSILSL